MRAKVVCLALLLLSIASFVFCNHLTNKYYNLESAVRPNPMAGAVSESRLARAQEYSIEMDKYQNLEIGSIIVSLGSVIGLAVSWNRGRKRTTK